MTTDTIATTTCPVCQSRLEADGVCLACFFNEAVEAEDTPSESVDGGETRTFAKAGPLPLPCEFAGYKLLREVASGGMGVVYEAEDRELKRTVALKMIRLAAFARQEEIMRFRTEAELAAQLDHPNIVPIHDVGEEDGIPFFTMKLIAGISLAQRLTQASEPLSAREAAALMMKVSRAVQHAHERGVLHRDLKPGNILLDERGEPHLTDFGLAKLLDDDSTLTRTTAQLGTPHYMSPEQAAGRVRQITTASDVWGLGVLLYQMLTLKLPFSGESSAEIMRRVTDESPVVLDLRGVNADLATLVRRCLEKEPSKRPAGAGFLADELERWLGGEAIHSRSVDSLERTWRWVRRNRTKAAALVLTSLALLIGSGVALWQRQQALQQLQEAESMTDLMFGTLSLFEDRRGGPVTTKEELVTEFLKRAETFEGSPQRQIELLMKAAVLSVDPDQGFVSYHKALEIAEQALSADDPLLWLLRMRVAITQPTGTDELKQKTIQELRRIIAWDRVHRGPEHSQTVNTMHLLAVRYSLWGRPAEGLALMEQIKALMEKNPQRPPLHPIIFEGAYMEALFHGGRVEEALKVGRASCTRWAKEVNSVTSHQVARTFDRLAVYHLRTGLLEEAARYSRQGVEIYWQFEGPGSKGGGHALNILLQIQRKQGDQEAVLATHRDALRAYDMAYGISRIETQRQVAAYADELAKYGRQEKAEALYLHWLERLRGSDGKLAPQAAELEKLYAAFLKKRGTK